MSDDNAFVGSLFRTAKYRPEYPAKEFADLSIAQEWASRFVGWYNQQHRHSGISYVTLEQRHAGLDKELSAARHQVYQQARAKHPARWSRSTRNWTPIMPLALNPERKAAVATAAAASIKSKAA